MRPCAPHSASGLPEVEVIHDCEREESRLVEGWIVGLEVKLAVAQESKARKQKSGVTSARY